MEPSQQPNGVWTFRGFLPHLAVRGVRQFVTFALADAMPIEVARRRADAERQACERSDRVAELMAAEGRLDAGAGACVLSDPRIAQIVEDALLHFDGDRYALLAWAVMPNHVHAAIALARDRTVTEVVQAWKSFTAREANRALGTRGRFWRKDFFDTRIRDDEHLARVVRYIERNPVAAKLCERPEQWVFGSARRRVRP
jgi:REP element-mobilizing transposase RayT